MVPPKVSDQLRGAGLRVTAPHLSVPQWLAGHPHATAEQIRARCSGDLPTRQAPTGNDGNNPIRYMEVR